MCVVCAFVLRTFQYNEWLMAFNGFTFGQCQHNSSVLAPCTHGYLHDIQHIANNIFANVRKINITIWLLKWKPGDLLQMTFLFRVRLWFPKHSQFTYSLTHSLILTSLSFCYVKLLQSPTRAHIILALALSPCTWSMRSFLYGRKDKCSWCMLERCIGQWVWPMVTESLWNKQNDNNNNKRAKAVILASNDWVSYTCEVWQLC